jgi:translation initiation factor IF-2
MAIKVSVLARELNITNDDLVEALRKLYVDIDGEDPEVDDKIADLMRVKAGIAKPSKKKTVKKEEPAVQDEAKQKKTSKKAPDKEPSAEPKVQGETKVAEEPVKKAPEKTLSVPDPKPEVIRPEGMSNGISPVVVVRRAPPKQESKDEHKGKDAEKKDSQTVSAIKPAAQPATPFKIEKVIVVEGEATSLEKKPVKGAKKEGFEADDQVAKKSKIFFKTKKTKVIETESWETVPEGAADRKVVKTPKIIIPVRQKKAEVVSEEIKPFAGTEYTKIELAIPTNIRAIAVKVNRRPNDIIQFLIKRKKIFANINQDLDEIFSRELLKDLGYELVITKTIEEDLMSEHHDDDEEKKSSEKRAPIVTFMGHVDHGKTSLLDYIRKTMVAKKEKGGITQHIGAYKVDTHKGSVTFLDTPGHEAFTAMRARGANITDVVVLVVAADDGVMPQTKEALDHAVAAGVPIVVAINKCDLPNCNPNKALIGLQKEGLMCEDLGGKTVAVKVSAKTGQGVDDLMEILMLESDLLELSSNPNLRARGIVLEGKKTAGQGVATTVIVKNGTLRLGDIVLCGIYYGKVKAMINDRGERIEEALPSTPVEILGLQGVPQAGDEFFVVKDEKKAKTLAMIKQGETKKLRLGSSQRITLEDFHNRMVQDNVKELKIIIKADVLGSIEALKHSLATLTSSEVRVTIVHDMIGDINESDAMLALVSNAVIIGFNVKVDPRADDIAKENDLDIKMYSIIYEAVDDVKAALEGLLEPIEQETIQGYAQVQKIFPAKNNKAAGCYVTRGLVHRKDRVRVKRGQEVVYDGTIGALKRFRDDVKDVREGMECGISFHNFNDIKTGDVVEAYVIDKIARRLSK